MAKLYPKLCVGCGRGYDGKYEQRYCSYTCYVNSRWVVRHCDQCGQEFRARVTNGRGGQARYCSKLCANRGFTRRPVIEFDGHSYTLNAYGHFFCHVIGKYLHRAMWEKEHGPIPLGYIIHHKDGDRQHNALENLELIEWGAHSSLHNRLSPRTPRKPPKQCAEIGCVQKVVARRLCSKHYERVLTAEKGGWRCRRKKAG